MNLALQALNVSKNFGGLQAVKDVSLRLEPGQIHGLIGPNGSGKTTLLNLFSGYYPLSAGRIMDGNDAISALPVHKRASRGIGRTFQKPRLLDPLTVLDNVMLGAWPGMESSFVRSMLGGRKTRREETRIRERALGFIEALGLDPIRKELGETLKHAEQKLTEIARGLMLNPRFILLDEPAGGLTEIEIERLAKVVKGIAGAGIGVLLVEHHTEFVFDISDTVTTLHLGEVIAAGAPAEVSSHPEVIRVYLGNC